MKEKVVQKAQEQLFTKNEYGFIHQKMDVVLDPEIIDAFSTEYGIRTDVHKTCINCQIRQILKYRDHEKGRDGNFLVKCNYIPKSVPHLGSSIEKIAKESNLSLDRAKKIVLSTVDPVAWAELMFGFDDSDEDWRLRSYQKEELRCSAKRAALRQGRRSGKSFCMALKLLYMIFNLQISKGRDSHGNEVIRGPEIIIITPFKSQLVNIFDEMEKLLKRNIELTTAVTTGTGGNLYIQSPNHKMEFTNGAIIEGFVSGIGVKTDGSGGGSIRGQSTDVLYLDEMDMIPDDILDKVVIPLLLTNSKVQLFASSTPIGKRGKFYEFCLNRPDFKEYYLPSTVTPQWEDLKAEIESDQSYTKDVFESEFMASFIESAYGVFKPSYVYGAMTDYAYDDCNEGKLLRSKLRIPDSLQLMKCIGIDWNKNAGTEFYVAGYSPALGKWFGLEAINVSAGEFSGKQWKEEVIRLNYKWKPDWIYADQGYGHTIIEDLKLYAMEVRKKQIKNKMDEQTIYLPDRLKAFDFKANIFLRDPMTGEEIKKTGKHYLVENAKRILEDNLFSFPESDTRLRSQMLNYIVLRYGQDSKPIYGEANDKIGDHRLDAWMLALAGLSIEESIYSGRNMSITAPAIINPESNRAIDELVSVSGEFKKNNIRGVVSLLQILRDPSIKGAFDHTSQILNRGSKEETPKQSYGHLFEGLAKHAASNKEFNEETSQGSTSIAIINRRNPQRSGIHERGVRPRSRR